MRHGLAGVVGVVSGLGLLIAACSSSPNSGSSGNTTSASKTVRFIEGGGLDYSDVPIYKAMALLDAEGYHATLANVADPTTAMGATLSGKEDIDIDAPVEAATAVEHSHAALKYIASDAQTTSYEIVALPKYNLHNLAGATIGSSGPGSAGVVIAMAALQKIGLSSSQIHPVNIGGTSARETAILAGKIDLAPLLAPAAVAAIATHKVKLLMNTGSVLGDYLQQGLIATNSFAANKATAQATVNAFINAERWADSNESGYIALANSHGLRLGLTPAEEKAAWSQLHASHFFAVNGALCSHAISQTLAYTYETPGELTKSTTPKLSTWVDPTYVNAYLKAHGQPAGTC